MGTVNDNIRTVIEESLLELKKMGIDEATAQKLFLTTLQFCNNQNPKAFVLAYRKLSVWFQDYYTILTYKIGQNTISTEEKQDYQKLLHLDHFLDVLNLWKKDYRILTRAFEASRKVYQLSTLGKIQVLKSLSREDDAYLTQIAPAHREDVEKYNQWVEPDLYLKSYQLQKKKSSEEEWKSLKNDVVIPRIRGFLKTLAIHDFLNFSSNVKEMISVDYMWSYYRMEKGNQDLEAQKRIAELEKNTLDGLAIACLNDQSYMDSILASYLSQKANEVPETASISEEEAEAFLEENKPGGYAKIKEFLY